MENQEQCIKKRNVWLDIFRYFLVFLVVCIHYNKTIFGISILPLTRIAVPMFFMISGFYMYGKTKEEEIKKSQKAIKRNAIYLLIGFAAVLCFNFLINLTNGTGIKSIFLSLFNPDNISNFIFLSLLPKMSCAVPMWFLAAIFSLSVFHYFLVKYDLTKLYKILIPTLIVLFLYPMFCNVFFSSCYIPSEYTRNWIFTGIPCFGIGYLLSRFLKTKDNNKCFWGYLYVVCFIIFWFASYLENYLLGNTSCYYVSSLIACVCLLLFFDFLFKRKPTNFEKKVSNFFYNWIGAGGSFYIYIFHGLLGTLLQKMFLLNGFYWNIIIFVTCFIFYELIFCTIKFLKDKKNNVEKPNS